MVVGLSKGLDVAKILEGNREVPSANKYILVELLREKKTVPSDSSSRSASGRPDPGNSSVRGGLSGSEDFHR